MSFDTYYPQNPWEGVTKKERSPWYYPQLYREFRRRAIFNRFVAMQFNHNGPRASELRVTSLTLPHVNHDPIGNREAWLNSTVMDTFERKITFQRRAGKFSFNRFDEMVTYLTLDNVRGLSQIINYGLAEHMSQMMDKPARDAFLAMPFARYGNGSGVLSGSNFSAIDGDDTMRSSWLQDVRLSLKERNNPAASREDGSLGETIIAITTPGAIANFQQQLATNSNLASFVDIYKYTDPSKIINGEVGTWMGYRFIENNANILYNCGAITHQTTVTAAIQPGDGAPDPSTTAVDGVEYVGQPGATHGITVADASGFAVGDYISIHVDRTSSFGVSNGADYRDGKKLERRIVAISGSTLRFSRPITESYTTDLGSGVYAYATKAVHVHATILINTLDAVAMGVAEPPSVRTLMPVDDLGMIYRTTYDFYMGWQPFNKHGAEVLFHGGSNGTLLD